MSQHYLFNFQTLDHLFILHRYGLTLSYAPRYILEWNRYNVYLFFFKCVKNNIKEAFQAQKCKIFVEVGS